MQFLSIANVVLAIALSGVTVAHEHDHHEDQVPLDYVRYPVEPLYRGASGEGKERPIHLHVATLLSSNVFSVTADAIFSGITTFARLPWVQCLSKDRNEAFDIAFLGAPFVGISCALFH